MFWDESVSQEEFTEALRSSHAKFLHYTFYPPAAAAAVGSGFAAFLSPLKRVSICKQVSQLKLNPISLAAREDFVTFKHLF